MSDYIVDLNYSSDIKQLQNPVRMDFVFSLITGMPMTSQKAYRYLDIGCGQGTTLISLAAANPDAEFYGVDLNKEHILEAKKQSDRFGLENISFIQSDLADLHTKDLPDFKYITTHGMYSWIPKQVRQKLLDYVSNKLVDDGIFYVHYAVLPGRSAIGPVWRLMQEYSSDIQGSYERTQKALGLVQQLLRSDKGYFDSYSIAKQRTTSLLSQDISYVAHESMNESWEANYHFELNREMEKRGMQYVGQASYKRNFWESCIPENLVTQFELSPSDEIKETIIDYIDMRPSRCDLYTKIEFSKGNRQFENIDCVFGSKSLDGTYSKKIELPNGSIQSYHEEIYQKLLRLLNIRPSTIKQLILDDELKSYSSSDITKAMENLIIGEQIQVLRRMPIQEITADVTGITIVGLYNQENLHPDNWIKEGITVVSPILGGAFRVRLLDAVLIYLVSMDPDLGIEERIAEILKSKNARQMAADGVKLNAQSLGQYVPLFLQERLWKYIQLGIVRTAK